MLLKCSWWQVKLMLTRKLQITPLLKCSGKYSIKKIDKYLTCDFSDLGGVFGFFLGASMINFMEYFCWRLPIKSYATVISLSIRIQECTVHSDSEKTRDKESRRDWADSIWGRERASSSRRSCNEAIRRKKVTKSNIWYTLPIFIKPRARI